LGSEPATVLGDVLSERARGAGTFSVAVTGILGALPGRFGDRVAEEIMVGAETPNAGTGSLIGRSAFMEEDSVAVRVALISRA
jgi:hypothetical protein